MAARNGEASSCSLISSSIQSKTESTTPSPRALRNQTLIGFPDSLTAGCVFRLRFHSFDQMTSSSRKPHSTNYLGNSELVAQITSYTCYKQRIPSTALQTHNKAISHTHNKTTHFTLHAITPDYVNTKNNWARVQEQFSRRAFHKNAVIFIKFSNCLYSARTLSQGLRLFPLPNFHPWSFSSTTTSIQVFIFLFLLISIRLPLLKAFYF